MVILRILQKHSILFHLECQKTVLSSKIAIKSQIFGYYGNVLFFKWPQVGKHIFWSLAFKTE